MLQASQPTIVIAGCLTFCIAILCFKPNLAIYYLMDDGHFSYITKLKKKKKGAGLTMHTKKKSEKAFTCIMIILDSEI
jgi:hypothetical protein